MPATGTLTLKLYYTRNSYTLTLNKNEYIEEVSLSETNKGSSVQGTYKYEEEVEITAKVGSQEGYTYGFTNFTSEEVTPVLSEVSSTETLKKAKVTMPAENVSITANGAREVNTYNIEYVLNGGTNSAQNPSTYTVEDTINLQPATREGYTFNGWFEKEEGTENLKDAATTVISGRTGNITLEAKWTQNEYKVIVNHYDKDNENELLFTETLKGDLGASYTAKNLMQKVENEEDIGDVDANKYDESNIEVVGSTAGTYTVEDITVSFYYNLKTFSITANAGANGSISNVTETVKYGRNSTKNIEITPNSGYKVKSIKVNNVDIEYTENRTTKAVNLDKFTNVTENKHIEVEFMEIIKVAKVIYVPDGWDEEHPGILNKEYEYLEDAINEVDTQDKGKFIIQIINNVANETNTINNKNITIDLNGHEVKAVSSENATFTIESGSLTIVDSASTGKVVNETGTAIYVKEAGSLFTLGTDDGEISYLSPLIQGATTGVNNHGTFEFNDGKIIGATAIEGEATTPQTYEAKVDQNGETQEAILGRVTGIEAYIGKTRYVTLEDAIYAANYIKGTPTDEIEIDVVEDLTKSAKIKVSNQKNIILDLNGHSITSAVSDYLFENSGKMQIKDSGGLNVEETEEEYLKAGIATRGKSVVNTGIRLSGNYKIETKARIESSDSWYHYLYSAGSGFTCYISHCSGINIKTNDKYAYGSKNFDIGIVYNFVSEFEDGTEKVSIDGEEITSLGGITRSNIW